MFNNKKKLQKYFKLASYKIFKLIYGEVKGKTSHIENEDIKLRKVKIDDINYDVFICNDCSYYTDTIHDSAVIKNRKIVEGPSFQLRNNVNVNCLDNSIFQNGTPRIRRKLKGTVFSLLTGGGGNTNYWHWLLDVLPRLQILKETDFNFTEIDYFLLPSLKKNFQKESLDLLNIDQKKFLSSHIYRHISADKIIITSHPYNLLNNPEVDSLNLPSWLSDYLRKNFLIKCLKKSKIKNFSKKIYINRKDGTSLRYIINESEVENYLEKEGFTSLKLSEYSFIDQVAIFHNANQIAGLHGAGFANIIFCKKGTKVIEMRPDSAGDLFKNLAINNNLNYFDITEKPKTINFNNQQGDIEINIDLLKQKINS